nr:MULTISPECIES: hypothetical protein [unclassified Roseofilum]
MTSTLPSTSTDRHTALPSIPPLENGDRLTRPEFERRYFNMTEVKKAELIGGVVYIASPHPPVCTVTRSERPNRVKMGTSHRESVV